jgi:hypothetical protein
MYGIINFQTNLGSVLMIRTVQVKPKDHAIIKCIFSEQDGDNQKHKILMEGDDYKLWGENDDYLGHYCINKITGGTETIVGSDYVEGPQLSAAHDDNRSVHNDADIAKIQTLEEQMVEQTRQLQQMRQIMISKGMI